MQLEPFAEGLPSAYYRRLESVLTEKPHPVRAIRAPGTQPSVSTRNPGNHPEALKKAGLLRGHRRDGTVDMDYADVVIPVTTMYETDLPIREPGATG